MMERSSGIQTSQMPYPGLRSFQRAEFDIFFGRDDHVSDMLEKLSENQFLCVTGPSGCGKSSLARTGLFNALEAGFLPGRGSDWIFCDLHPETDPLDRLCAALGKAIIIGESGRGSREPKKEEADEIAELNNLFLNHIEDRSSDLCEAVEKVTAVRDRPIVILIDQFEEIFRYAQDDPNAASRFVDVLLKTSAARRNIYVVITIRTDELAKCARYSGLTNAINQSQFLTPTLDRFQMREAIEGPVSLFDGTVAEDLSIWMLNGLEEQLDKLPLMQHALHLLYLHARKDQPRGHLTITLVDFFRIFGIEEKDGGIRSESHDALRTSLSHRLDTIYRHLSKADRRIARALFCALTTLESRGRDIRHPIKLGVAAKIADCAFDDLVRVIGTFKDGDEAYLRIAGEQDGIDPGDTVDVTHECVLRLWEPLSDVWLPEEQKAAENIRHLARQARDREEQARLRALDRLLGRGLLKGHILGRYTDWWRTWQPNESWAKRHLESFVWRSGKQKRSTVDVFRAVDAYIDDSRTFKKRSGISVALSILAMLALGGIWGADRIQSQQAEAELKQKQEALTRELILRDVWEKISQIDPSENVKRPVEFAQRANGVLRDAIEIGVGDDGIAIAREKVLGAMGYAYEWRRFNHGGKGEAVYGAQYMPGARSFATLSETLVLRIWDSGEIAAPMEEINLKSRLDGFSSDRGRTLAVSPQGDIAVGTQQGAVILVPAPESENPEVRVLYAGTGTTDSTITGLDFSPDGRDLIASSLFGRLRHWRRDDGDAWALDRVLRMDWLSKKSSYAAFLSPLDETSTTRGYRAWSTAFSPRGDLIGVGLDNGTVCILLTEGNQKICDANGHEKAVKAIAFAKDQDRIVTGGNDDNLRVWDLTAGRLAGTRTYRLLLELSPLVFWQESDIWDVAFSADGDYLAAIMWDGQIRVFNARNWRPLTAMRGHTRPPRSIAFSPDGQRLLTGALDRTARIWTSFVPRTADPELSARLPWAYRARSIRAVAVGQDASWVAMTNGQKIWIKEPGQTLRQITQENGDKMPERYMDLATPVAASFFMVAHKAPSVSLWRRDADGLWQSEMRDLRGAGSSGNFDQRHVALSADGSRFAVDVKLDGAYHVLICETDAATCNPDPDNHVALIRTPRDYDQTRDPDHDCRKIPNYFINALAIAPGGDKIAIGTSDCNLRLYDIGGDGHIALSEAHDGSISGVDFFPAAEAVAAASTDWSASLWRLPGGESTIMRGHDSALTDVASLPSGVHMVTAARDERLIVWNIETDGQVFEYPGYIDTITSLDAKPHPIWRDHRRRNPGWRFAGQLFHPDQ